MSQTFSLKPWDWTLFMLNPCVQHKTKSKGLNIPGTRKWHCPVMSILSHNSWWGCRTVLYTCVGVMWLMSSDASCLSKVVFPPLSKPSSSILTSWSGVLFSLRRMDSNPCKENKRISDKCDVTLPERSAVAAKHHCRHSSLSIHPLGFRSHRPVQEHS